MRTIITDLTGVLVSIHGYAELQVFEEGEGRYYRLSDLLNVCFAYVPRPRRAALTIDGKDVLVIEHETDVEVLNSQILAALDRALVNFNEQLRVRWIGLN